MDEATDGHEVVRDGVKGPELVMFTVKVEVGLRHRVAAQAKADGVPLSQWVRGALVDALPGRKWEARPTEAKRARTG